MCVLFQRSECDQLLLMAWLGDIIKVKKLINTGHIDVNITDEVSSLYAM